MLTRIVTTTLILLAAFVLPAAAADTIRIGVLKFGTVNWELDTIVKNGIAERHGVSLEITAFAGEDSSAIAFRAGEVDVIVTDWLEVARMRADGEDVTFAPYSGSTGALMVRNGSPLKSIADLKGVKIGVAGGPLDKNWLLLQGMAAKVAGLDIAKENDIAYGAPPLVSEKLRSGEFDVALNFWQFNARLEAAGFLPIAGGQDASRALGAAGPVSTLGYVFHGAWAEQNRDAVLAFLDASREAKALLKSSDAEWDRLHADGLIKDEGEALAKLRDRFRDGIPTRPVRDEQADAARLFEVLKETGGEKLVGSAATLPDGTFWPPLVDGD